MFDLRDNSGGANLLRGLFNELARRVGDGRIGRTFVITGRRTFSAAVYDADAMRRDTDAGCAGRGDLGGFPGGTRPGARCGAEV